MSFNVSKYTQSKWLKGSDLPVGRLTQLTIKAAYEHTFEQTQETKPCLDFYEIEQSLPLNRTQIGTLVSLFGDEAGVWPGQRINLQAVPSNYQGKPTVLISSAEGPMPTFNGQPVGNVPTPPTAKPSTAHPFQS
jgi:hypothetical protein